jgi:DNA-binding response OmpR family regulator
MFPVKILYVEDEPFLAKIVMETLVSKGYEVVHVDNGNHALNAFHKHTPDICVLDVMLPGKDGFTLGSEISSFNPDLPIIYLTAKDQTEDLVKGFSSGGNDYIRKPFSMEELIVRVDNLLRISRSTETLRTVEILKSSQIELNTLKMELTTPDGKIQLSHRENEILKLLFSASGGQVERKDILLKVWGDDSFFNSRNLDVYIRKIRKYLSADPNINLLTLKGIGYRLVVDAQP